MSAPIDCDSDYNPCAQSGGGNAQANYQAALQQQEAMREAAARQAAAQAEKMRLFQEEEARKKQEEIDRQARFIQERDEAAGTLKAPLGTSITSNGASQLKGTGVDTGIKELRTEQHTRDLGGRTAAWKQLNCAAAISHYALAAIIPPQPGVEPDFAEFHDLASEALNALNGQAVGVQCPSAPAAPKAYGHEGYEKYNADFKALLVQAERSADQLKDARAKRQAASDQMAAAKTNEMAAVGNIAPKDQGRKDAAPPPQDPSIEAVRQKQREINVQNDQKADQMKSAMAAALAAQRAAQSEFDKENHRAAVATRELNHIDHVAKDLEGGDSNAVSLLDQANEQN